MDTGTDMGKTPLPTVKRSVAGDGRSSATDEGHRLMGEVSAIKVAIDLIHLPSRLQLVRSERLPPGIENLLRIAAGDEQAEIEVAALTDRPRSCHPPSGGLLYRTDLGPQSDSYRVLGSTSSASTQDLRRNMALLLMWLHPDKDPRGERSLFAARVTGAWDNLKCPERRAAYDATLGTAPARVPSHSSGRLSAAKQKNRKSSVKRSSTSRQPQSRRSFHPSMRERAKFASEVPNVGAWKSNRLLRHGRQKQSSWQRD